MLHLERILFNLPFSTILGFKLKMTDLVCLEENSYEV